MATKRIKDRLGGYATSKGEKASVKKNRRTVSIESSTPTPPVTADTTPRSQNSTDHFDFDSSEFSDTDSNTCSVTTTNKLQTIASSSRTFEIDNSVKRLPALKRNIWSSRSSSHVSANEETTERIPHTRDSDRSRNDRGRGDGYHELEDKKRLAARLGDVRSSYSSTGRNDDMGSKLSYSTESVSSGRSERQRNIDREDRRREKTLQPVWTSSRRREQDQSSQPGWCFTLIITKIAACISLLIETSQTSHFRDQIDSSASLLF